MRTPDSWQTARATVAIALLTVVVHLIVTIFEIDRWAIGFGSFIPAALTLEADFARLPFFLTPLSAALLHASLLHLIFNLIILLFCGRAVEGALGPVNLVILYIVGAFAAAAGHYVAGPSEMIPMVGASGAISAVIGAYAMLFGRNRVRVADPRLALWLNVLWLLAAWVVLQVAMGIVFSAGTGILLAVGAHIGGFVAGVILARPLLLWRYRRA
ncbi:MAG TPA: rhomboid family intramembrane serine protease [Allosphingosinicella sp.]